MLMVVLSCGSEISLSLQQQSSAMLLGIAHIRQLSMLQLDTTMIVIVLLFAIILGSLHFEA